ncbi:MAG: flagellar biosynthetic protein FliQ [Cyanobacteria bacterium]|nr:flagellar biosynthetic protein FliQ [Cyanobacteriota bacterium]
MVLLSTPALMTSMVVGIGISIVQTVTQIQESTLTFVPKILITLFVFVLTSSWMVETIVNHTAELFNSLAKYAR